MSQYIHTEEIHNTRAAEIILPIVFENFRPDSVLDIGCGLGTWLAVCQRLGIKDLAGIDGPGLSNALLAVNPDIITLKDLTRQFSLQRRFDLAICLEVAEHLPAESADVLVASITAHADTILFSAAIPGQGGQHHLNEQWPAYWQAKFEKHGYYFHDPIRPRIWDNQAIEWWYRQNIFIVVKGEKPLQQPNLSMIHPELHDLRVRNEIDYRASLSEGRQGVLTGMKILLNAIGYKLKTLFHRGK